MHFSTFDALLRITHKYEAPHIFPLLFKHLAFIALVALDGPWGLGHAYSSVEATAFPVTVLISDADVLEVLVIVRCIGASNTLPTAAFSHSYLCGPDLLRDGITLERGVVRRLSEDLCIRCVALSNAV